MKGDRVPDDHDVVRYCGPSTIDGGVLQGPAFTRKNANEAFSVNDASQVPGRTLRDRATASKQLMAPWIKMKINGRLAAVQVGALRGVETIPPLDVLEDPEAASNTKPPNPAHCEILGLPTEEELTTGKLSVVLEVIAAVGANHWRIGDL